ncbi:hypothetical protein BJ742DRAFT_799308 [Cladochytrium replicatum]|nr:hypothetical protein BJ742DRAFT_799308 [Cladochytrium replicatum]
MGLFSAAQARAISSHPNTPAPVAATYYSQNAYIPSPTEIPQTTTTSTALPAGATSSAGNSRDWYKGIHHRLLSTVESNKLQPFYSTEDIEKLALRVWDTVNIQQLGRRWRIPKELALDLVALALYDIVLFGDDSGSMQLEDGGRIQDLSFIVTKVTEISVLFDNDGISVRFMNSSASLDNGKNESQIAALFAEVEFNYGTPLGTKIEQKVVQPFVLSPATSGNLKKPVLVISITDGEPTQEPEEKIIEVIASTKRSLEKTKYGGGAVAFQFSQVGTDFVAQAFLKMLDDHSQIGNLIDCTSAFELEQEECLLKGVELSPEVWLVKLMCGAIDPQYDNQD